MASRGESGVWRSGPCDGTRVAEFPAAAAVMLLAKLNHRDSHHVPGPPCGRALLRHRYVICNRQGLVLRRFPAMSQEHAEAYAEAMRHLANKARGVMRDLNPKVRNHSDRDHRRQHKTHSFCPFLSLPPPLHPFPQYKPSIQNELRYLRIRAKRHEVMIAFGERHSDQCARM